MFKLTIKYKYHLCPQNINSSYFFVSFYEVQTRNISKAAVEVEGTVEFFAFRGSLSPNVW